MGSKTSYKIFVNGVVEQVEEKDRCDFLRKDNCSYYCSNGLKEGDVISNERRNVCDHFSLQLWCLSKSNCQNCIWYNGKEKFS